MSNIDFLFEDTDDAKAKEVVRHCRSCWRREVHKTVVISPFVLGFLTVLSLGLILIIRPSRCVCCGKIKTL